MMTVREQGSSNKSFYYMTSGAYTTFNMRVEIVMKEHLQVERWALCVEMVCAMPWEWDSSWTAYYTSMGKGAAS